jgi:hypothetical protein
MWPMLGVRGDLIVPLDGVDTERLLEFWRWLVPAALRPWFVTALGDLFLRGEDRAVWWLDAGSAKLTPVGHGEKHFEEVLADPENRLLWLGERLVDRLRDAGLSLGPGECYSYWVAPVLGGEYAPENFRVYDVVTHFRVWGPIHEKLKDLPDGTKVEFVIEE